MQITSQHKQVEYIVVPARTATSIPVQLQGEAKDTHAIQVELVVIHDV